MKHPLQHHPLMFPLLMLSGAPSAEGFTPALPRDPRPWIIPGVCIVLSCFHQAWACICSYYF